MPVETPTSNTETVRMEDRLKQVASSLIWQKPISVKDEDEGRMINRPGSFYRRYQKVEDLPASAKAIYIKAGKLFVFKTQDATTGSAY